MRTSISCLLGFLIAVAAGCSNRQPRPPIARIHLDPAAIPAGDARATIVTLDGSTSADDFHDPTAPLAYQWSWDDDDATIADGNVNAPVLHVRFSGRFPVTVRLRVWNAAGHDASVFARLALTLPD